jgi:alginate O-acetyltransferase complex protein AlgJ
MKRPEPRLSREEIAKREIGRTNISPTLSWVMVLVFLITITAVPILQSIQEIQGGRGSSTGSHWPGWCGIVAALDGVSESYRTAGGDWSAKVLAANARLLKNLHEYEGRLEDESLLTRRLLGPTQYGLTRFGGLGNEKAYVGVGRWLFYRPGVDYVTGPGFLDPATLARRASGGNEYTAAPQPDPRPAIPEFQERLAQAGVRLILMPTPAKSMVEPEQVSTRYRDWPDVVQNPSYARFQAEMDAAGVLVFDPAPILLERKRRTGQPQFLTTDTHWTPDAMQVVAEHLSRFIEKYVPMPARPALAYRSHSMTVRNLGDIAVMMQLPSRQDLFPRQEVTIRQVLQPDGSPWQSSPDADVMLLGDSYTNIYSMPGMNWGEAAGLAEQLSFTMGRAVDRIAQNDAGAHATRQALALELARGRDRLAGKRVLIWQFAIRELAVGDWKRLPWNEVKPVEPTPPDAPAAAEAGQPIVRGRIKAISEVPRPGSVPYRDAIAAVHLVEVEATRGAAPAREVVVYLWGLRDNRLTSAAGFRPGQSVTLTLTPWERARGKYERFTRIELDDPDFVLIDLPTYWADEVP